MPCALAAIAQACNGLLPVQPEEGIGNGMYRLLRPLMFRIEPERAHALTIAALARWPARPARAMDPVLTTHIAGLTLPTPIGLAAGFDKDARVWRQMLGLGFGFVEVGTLTPRPQAGNPRPRIFRLTQDRAIINRLGFNGGGIEAALPRLAAHPQLGVNVGANRDSADRIADYAQAIGRVRGLARWITINISSPNTPGLRGLQGAALPELLAAAAEARGVDGPPLFLKLAPDLDEVQLDAICDTVLASRVAALIIGNTTISRPAGLRSHHAGESGGLSGAPLAPLAGSMLGKFARRLGGRLPLIAAGGIGSAADAYGRIRAGASAVQLYTALAYEGPQLAARMARELAALLRRDGFQSVAEAVGVDRP